MRLAGEKKKMSKQKSESKPPLCTCIQDPYADLPPELRPKPVQKIGGLRKVTCPSCGKSYWTNRAADLCVDCEKKGVSAEIKKKGA